MSNKTRKPGGTRPKKHFKANPSARPDLAGGNGGDGGSGKPQPDWARRQGRSRKVH